MRLDELVFVTSNLGKLREAEAVLGCKLNHRALDIDEVQSLDLEEVVRHKAASAYGRLGSPVLVEDTSLELAGFGMALAFVNTPWVYLPYRQSAAQKPFTIQEILVLRLYINFSSRCRSLWWSTDFVVLDFGCKNPCAVSTTRLPL